MSRDPEAQDLPAPLVDGDGPAAELLRRFQRVPPHAPPEPLAWERTLARLGRSVAASRARIGLVGLCGALAGAAAIWLVLRPSRPQPVADAPVVVRAPSPSLPPSSYAPVAPPSVGIPRIQLGRAAVGLPVGAADLVGEARVRLSAGGRARALALDGATSLDLDAGQIDLEVERHTPERAFDVVAGVYRFSVLGTTFHVGRAAGQVTLSVADGRVAVYRGTRLLAVVARGGSWSSAPAPSSPAAPPGGGDGDLGAEVALYQAARAERDGNADPAAALRLLREHQRRFPAGALRTEVELSIVEILPALGRYREALDETALLLRRARGGERAGEISLLRGHLLREHFQDCASAEKAYAAAEGGGGRAAGAAAYWRAVCLENLGRRDEARAGYRHVLDQQRGGVSPEAEAARRRLLALEK